METTETTTEGQQSHPIDQKPSCEAMPDLTRLRYFHGQMLVANDLQAEQDYFIKKLKLLNRCLHGYGTVCGLKVVAVPPDKDCDPKQEPPHRHARVRIECGLALDCEGNELVVNKEIPVDLWQSLDDAEKRRVEALLDGREGRARIYLSICYCVQPIDPVRPVLPDACGAVSECVYSKLRDSVRVNVSLERPHENKCGQVCCEKCKDKCLLLAAIDLVKNTELADAHIHNDVRRWISVYDPTVITGINWSHAGVYEPDDAEKILQNEGLIIEFSRDITGSPIFEGVVDVQVIEGSKGRRAGIYSMEGDLSLAGNNRLVFKQTSEEDLQDGDRVIVTVRADFILDECCRPVDGNHVGGKTPILKGYEKNARRPKIVAGSGVKAGDCARPPRRYGDWTSGNGSPGGSFESWIFITRTKGKTYDPPASASGTGTADQASASQ